MSVNNVVNFRIKIQSKLKTQYKFSLRTYIYWIDQLYDLRFTDNGCKEVFSDYAQYVKVLPEVEPGTQIISAESDNGDGITLSDETGSARLIVYGSNNIFNATAES